MTNTLLIIFPSPKQISLLCSLRPDSDSESYTLLHEHGICEIYAVLRAKDDIPDSLDGRVKFISCNDLDTIRFLQDSIVQVLCCHEEAVFWAGKYRGAGWRFRFDPKYFAMLEKHTFKAFCERHDIPTARYSLSTGGIREFPAIAKPSIGFGSICVHDIRSISDAEAYAENFDAMIRESGIYSYQNEYFADKINVPIFEEAVCGKFYRTPFVVEGGKCIGIFPVRGITRRRTSSTDFNWIEFGYSPEDSARAAEITAELHDTLALCLSLEDGVYISEFMLTEDNRPVLLEFSPRQPSTRISRVVYFAEGIDLEHEAMMYFLRKSREESCHKLREVSSEIRLRLKSAGVDFAELKGYEELQITSEVSVHSENIQCKYFRKLA